MNINAVFNKNNEGVELLQCGRYRAAKRVFRDALLQLKDLSPSKFHLPIVVEPRLVPHKAQSKNFLYQNALLVSVDRKIIQSERVLKLPKDGNDDQPIHPSAAVVYNLSLAYHLCIMDSYRSKSSRIRLEQVLSMYKKALHAMNFRPLSDRINVTDQHLLRDAIFLGILNNIGVLNYEFDDYEHARFCFNTLKPLMNSASLLVLGKVAHRGILMNAWILEEPNTAQAA